MQPELPGSLIAILGFLAPLLIQIIVKSVPNEVVRLLIALVLSAVTGVVATWMKYGAVSFDVVTIGLIFGMATLAYQGFWKQIVFNRTKGLMGFERRQLIQLMR